ncbi:MAG: exodeoxyribonuclease VII small subunit [Flavobacteriales bacterium]
MSEEAKQENEGDTTDGGSGYTASMEELERIVREIEDANISVDELSDKVKRASVLIRYCRSKLHNTEEEVEEVLKQIREEKEGEDKGGEEGKREE